jgi:uncharacterized protein YbjT (DUF2867 family)
MESGMSIAVTAPTGHIGSQLTHRLLAAGAPVTLLVRDRRKVAEQVKRGARVAEGSLTDASFVAEATKGAQALFWLTPPDPTSTDLRAHQARLGRIAAEAVRRNGIPLVVNVSSIGADLGHGTGPVDGLYDVEGALDGAARNVIHLRCAFFMENYLSAAPGIVKDGCVYFPVRADTRTPMIATRDVAEVATEYLLSDKDRGRRVVYVYGPADLTFGEAAAALTTVLGRPVRHVAVSPEQALTAMVEAGLSAHVASQMIELDKALDDGYLLSGTPASPDRRTRTTFERFAREVLRPALAGMARTARG